MRSRATSSVLLFLLLALMQLCAAKKSAGTSSRQEHNLVDMLYGSYGSVLLPHQEVFQREESEMNVIDSTSRSSGGICNIQNDTAGICLTSLECEEIGGKELSACESPGQVCCVVEKSCRNVSKEAVSYFVNPSYPNRDKSGSFCDFRIDVINEDICQIRLDFHHFSVSQPHKTMGICRHDRFIVMTSALPNGSGLSELCGENSGQHMYIPVDASQPEPSISVMMMTLGQEPYKWRIKATQINCKTMQELVAPAGCLQYHIQQSGEIQSFNYNNGMGHYQSHIDYAICIRRTPSMCQIQFKQVEGSKFWINSIDGQNIEDGIGRAGTLPCDTISHDYLHIPDGRGGGTDEVDAYGDIVPLSSGSSDKFCGRSLSGFAVIENLEKLRTGYILDPPDNTSFPSTVTSFTSGPLVLRFHTDEVTEPKQEIGFHISYQQLNTGCLRLARKYFV